MESEFDLFFDGNSRKRYKNGEHQNEVVESLEDDLDKLLLLNDHVEKTTKNDLENKLGVIMISSNTRRREEKGEMNSIKEIITDGDKRLIQILMAVKNSSSIKLTHDQLIIFWNLLCSNLPLIYGPDWEKSSRRIMRTLKIRTLVPFRTVMAPRRIGKTTINAFMSAIMCKYCYDILVIVMAPTDDAAKLLCRQVKKFLVQFDAVFMKDTEKEIFILPQKYNFLRGKTKSEISKIVKKEELSSVVGLSGGSKIGKNHSPSFCWSPLTPESR